MAYRNSFLRGGMVLVLLAFFLGTALAQIPDEFKNLEVLPKDISKRELVSIMRQFAGALGQRCVFCHVPGPDASSLEGMDFASDEPEHKRIARTMMRMVADINENHLAALDAKVQCFTCHHGVQEPQRINDILMETITEEGVEAGLAKYKEMREEYYGRAAYDFSSGPLNDVAEQLAEKEDLDGAVAVMQKNIELNPDEAYPHILLAQIYAQKGDKEAAIANAKRALEIEPDNGYAKRVLGRLESGN